MSRALQRLYAIMFGLILLGGWMVNAFVLQASWLGAILAFLWVSWCGMRLGARVAREEDAGGRLAIGLYLLTSLIMIVGAVAYYSAEFTPILGHAIVVVTIVASACFGEGSLTALKTQFRQWMAPGTHQTPVGAWVLAVIGSLLLGSVVAQLVASSVTDAVRTPWAHVAPSAFVAFFGAFACFIPLWLRGRERPLTLTLAIASLGVFLSTALLIFPLGAGFDPFIHRATVSHIAEHGTIVPKPLYYVGQYALELTLHHGFGLPIEQLDRWLLIFFAALLLPLTVRFAARHLLDSRRAAAAAMITLFLFPLSSFGTTTPQGLGNLWLLLLVLASVPAMTRFGKPTLWLLIVPALATALIHPIAGIPALVFLALAIVDPQRVSDTQRPWAQACTFFIAVAGSIALPASFVVNRLRAGQGLGLDLGDLTPSAILSSLHLNLFFQNGFKPVLDFAYVWGGNAVVALLALAAFGYWLHRGERSRALRACIIAAVVAGVNYVLLATAVDFSFLIDYERGAYAERLIPIICFLLSPLILMGAGRMLARVRLSPVAVRAFVCLTLAGIITAAWYLSVPRHDAFTVGRGFNTAQADFDTVYAIEQDAASKPYVVLANQSVSAAAIHTFGFKQYWGDVFFYPVPTGGPLYQTFLDMNEAPDRTGADRARAITQEGCAAVSCSTPPPKQVYYVVNSYWWQSARLIELGKQTADAWFAIGKGEVYVFRYDEDEEVGSPPSP